MKAVILEKLNQECIVLAEDESMHTIPAPAGLTVGDVVDLTAYLRRQRSSRKRWQRVMATAAVLLIALCGTFYYTTFTVSATVTTEGEAPIVYYLNHRGQVLRAEALNKEGEKVLKSMGGVEGRPDLEDVLAQTEAVMQKKGYLAEDEHLTYTTDRDKDGKADEKDTVQPAQSGGSKSPARKETTVQKQADPDQDSEIRKPDSRKPPGNTPGKDPAQPSSGDHPGDQGSGDNGGQSGGGTDGGDSGDPNVQDPGSGGNSGGSGGGGQNPPAKDPGSGGNSGGSGGQKPPADSSGGEGSGGDK